MPHYHPGDIIEIRTDSGLGYVHLTHEHESYPPAVRILKGIQAVRPADIASHVVRAPRTVAMIPLEQALDRLGLPHQRVGTLSLLPAERAFPTFRTPIRDKEGKIVYWWFWDGHGLTYSVDLDDDQKDFPLREVISASKLLDTLTSAA